MRPPVEKVEVAVVEVKVAKPETLKFVVVALVDVELIIVKLVIVEVALLVKMPPLKVARPVAPIVPMLTRLPLTSIRLVPAPAPVLIPVVPLRVVPVMVLAVAIVPKPLAIEPELKAATCVKEELTTELPKLVADKILALLI